MTRFIFQSAGHDAGISMGSAQYHFFNNLQKMRVEPLYNANLGISFENFEIKNILDSLKLKKYNFIEDDLIFHYVANAISANKVIGLTVTLNLDHEHSEVGLF